MKKSKVTPIIIALTAGVVSVSCHNIKEIGKWEIAFKRQRLFTRGEKGDIPLNQLDVVKDQDGNIKVCIKKRILAKDIDEDELLMNDILHYDRWEDIPKNIKEKTSKAPTYKNREWSNYFLEKSTFERDGEEVWEGKYTCFPELESYYDIETDEYVGLPDSSLFEKEDAEQVIPATGVILSFNDKISTEKVKTYAKEYFNEQK